MKPQGSHNPCWVKDIWLSSLGVTHTPVCNPLTTLCKKVLVPQSQHRWNVLLFAIDHTRRGVDFAYVSPGKEFSEREFKAASFLQYQHINSVYLLYNEV